LFVATYLSTEKSYRYLTKKPHIAGEDEDEVSLVNYIKTQWTEFGIENVVVRSYKVLLSYPKQNDSNYVSVVLKNGTEVDISQKKELVIDEEQNNPNVVNPYNAYSAAGDPEVR